MNWRGSQGDLTDEISIMVLQCNPSSFYVYIRTLQCMAQRVSLWQDAGALLLSLRRKQQGPRDAADYEPPRLKLESKHN